MEKTRSPRYCVSPTSLARRQAKSMTPHSGHQEDRYGHPRKPLQQHHGEYQQHFRCPKVLFHPNFIGKEASGIQDTTSRPSCRPIWTSAKISTATSCFRDGTTCYAFEASHGGNPCLVTQLLRTKFRRMASRNGLASVARTHPKVRCGRNSRAQDWS